MPTVQELKERLRKKGLKVSGTKAELEERLQQKSNILDLSIYRKATEKVKKRVKVWPSAYASGQVVKEYKRMGGRYKNTPKNTPKKDGIDRWFKEKWVNVCEKGMPPCGRKVSSPKKYPYCRPKVRVNKSTPRTVSEMKKLYGTSIFKEMCMKKRRSPYKYIKP